MLKKFNEWAFSQNARLTTFALKSSNIDFLIKLLLQLSYELLFSEMKKKMGVTDFVSEINNKQLARTSLIEKTQYHISKPIQGVFTHVKKKNLLVIPKSNLKFYGDRSFQVLLPGSGTRYLIT